MEEIQLIDVDKISSELKFSFSRSGGPGGQNVNKVNTKVELRFDIANTQFLNQKQKELINEKLANQISQEGVLILISQASRSQFKNKEDVVARFIKLINNALTPEKKRKPNTISKAAKESRLQEKKQIAEKKERRRLKLD